MVALSGLVVLAQIVLAVGAMAVPAWLYVKFCERRTERSEQRFAELMRRLDADEEDEAA